MRKLCCSWLLLLAGASWADEGSQWLERMASAQQQQSFSGTFVYARNGHLQSHSIWKKVSGAEVREHLLQLDGSANQWLSVNGRLQCASQGPASLSSMPQPSSIRPLDTARLSQYYQVRMMDTSRVASRAAQRLLLLPKDAHRYALELSLDQQSALPLKSLLLSSQGEVLERLQYTQFSLNAPDDAQMQVDASCQSIPSTALKATRTPNWQANWLPQGFVLQEAWQQPSPVDAGPLLTLIYGDGLLYLTAFIEPLENPNIPDARSQHGPTAFSSKRVRSPLGDFMVTVLGEVPLATVERVALSMQPLKEAR